MAWLPEGEQFLKICLFAYTQLTNVTDRQTDTHIHRHRITAKTALDASIARQKLLQYALIAVV